VSTAILEYVKSYWKPDHSNTDISCWILYETENAIYSPLAEEDSPRLYESATM
jgi:hypothetical protein